MLDSKIRKVQSREHTQVLGASDKLGTTVLLKFHTCIVSTNTIAHHTVTN